MYFDLEHHVDNQEDDSEDPDRDPVREALFLFLLTAVCTLTKNRLCSNKSAQRRPVFSYRKTNFLIKNAQASGGGMTRSTAESLDSVCVF